MWQHGPTLNTARNKLVPAASWLCDEAIASDDVCIFLVLEICWKSWEEKKKFVANWKSHFTFKSFLESRPWIDFESLKSVQDSIMCPTKLASSPEDPNSLSTPLTKKNNYLDLRFTLLHYLLLKLSLFLNTFSANFPTFQLKRFRDSLQWMQIIAVSLKQAEKRTRQLFLGLLNSKLSVLVWLLRICVEVWCIPQRNLLRRLNCQFPRWTHWEWNVFDDVISGLPKDLSHGDFGLFINFR